MLGNGAILTSPNTAIKLMLLSCMRAHASILNDYFEKAKLQFY